MRKIIAALLALAMVASMSMTALAATNGGGNTSIDISATFKAGEAAEEVVSVDVSWGEMKFEYVEASEGVWNPKTHAYEGATEAKWNQSGNEIRLTNHSNVGIRATFTYEKAVETVTGTFSHAEQTLASAENTAYADAPTATTALTLSGELTESAKVGKVTVAIAKQP